MRQVVVGIVLVLDISLEFCIGKTTVDSAGSHNRCIHTASLFPVDEISHRVDKIIVADDQKVTIFVHRRVFGLRGLIVDEMTPIEILEIRVCFHNFALTRRQGVLAVIVHLVHLHG